MVHAGDTVVDSFQFDITFQEATAHACTTTGLQNIPSDNSLSQTYVLGNPTLSVPLGNINNGDCDFTMQVYFDSVGNSAAISDIGLTFIAPVVDAQPPAFDTYTVTSDGEIQIQTADYSLYLLTKTVYVVVTSVIDATSTQTFTFQITYNAPCTTTGL